MRRSILPASLLLALASTLASATIPEVESSAKDRPDDLEYAPRDTARLPFPDDARERIRDLDAWFEAHPGHRVHASLDRPLYRPGETVHVKVWDLATKGLDPANQHVAAQLLDPRGTAHQARGVSVVDGAASLSFTLDAAAPGGSWKVQITPPGGAAVERPFTVASFQAPRVKKELEFARDSYGPGEQVVAAVSLERSTGELLADTPITARVQAGGVALDPMQLRTDSRGEAAITFALPARLESPDVLLTVLVDDGGVTESISRPVPVVLDRVAMAFFPEGGDMVLGLPTRVYFEVTDPSGEPAEVEGAIVDDLGREVTHLRTWVDGRGHVSFTPRAGRAYTARIDSPADLETAAFALPAPVEEGCVLRHHDDLEGVQGAVRVSVRCTEAQDVMALATQQESVLDRAVFHVREGRATTVHLRSGDAAIAGAQGVARVTVFSEDVQPLAERLVYRNKGRQLTVQLTPDQERYAPRDEVVLGVRTLDPEGRPVPAELSLSVVDDALLAYADDSEHTLMSRVLLQADLPEPIEDVAEYFDPDSEDGALGLDLTLGTRGWRRFDWAPVVGFAAQQRQLLLAQKEAEERSLRYGRHEVYELELDDWADEDVGMAFAGDAVEMVAVRSASGVRRDRARRPKAKTPSMEPPPEAPMRQFAAAPAGKKDAVAPAGEEVRVRSDFRDTVAWEPVVKTNRSGRAEVRFTLSDAVTGFRATAEGLGDGWLGRGDALITSTLPFYADARIPVALSAGDELLLPITVESQRSGTLGVDIAVGTSDLLELQELPGHLRLSEGERRTVFAPMVALPGSGPASVVINAQAGEVGDALTLTVPVAPRGFPQSWSASGILEGRVAHELAVPVAQTGSIHARVTVFPSPVSEMVEGLENMVRMPGGCFEQTSSTNYPNVLVLDWLDQSDNGGKLAVDREAVLAAGYNKLSGYQVGSGGFETWGSGPGKEALSAFGLLQFSDMAKVYDVDPGIIDGNVKYLYQQRNGKGGYSISGSSAHGYGTAPPEVLDAYITYAMVETGHTDLDVELEAMEALSARSEDPYRLALATLALLEARPAAGKRAAQRLAGLQVANGSFPGSETSITRSENHNLDVEASALAAIAMVRSGDIASAQQAVEWIQSKQRSPGIWGASQANALALKAISTVAQGSAQMDGPGTIEVRVDGETVATAHFDAGRREPIDLDIGQWMTQGGHEVVITLDDGALPYALEVGWASETPRSDASRRLELSTSLAADAVKLGETDRLTARLSNRTDEVVPDPIARIGLPAGLTAQTWQLEQLKREGVVAFFETRPREVTLYWDGIGADEVHEVVLDLVAEVPGRFTAPASAAYPYYDDGAKSWVAGSEVRIAP